MTSDREAEVRADERAKLAADADVPRERTHSADCWRWHSAECQAPVADEAAEALASYLSPVPFAREVAAVALTVAERRLRAHGYADAANALLEGLDDTGDTNEH